VVWLSYACDSLRRALAQGEFNGEDLASLQARIQDEEQFNYIEAAIRSQRAYSWAHFRQWQDGFLIQREEYENPPVIKRRQPANEPPWYLTWMPSGNPNEPRVRQARSLRRFNGWLEFSKKPVADQVADFAAFKKHQDETLSESVDDVMAWQAPRIWTLRMRLRTSLTAVALERYRRTEGNWPVSLEKLVPEYLPSVPEDFYSRKPLVYRQFDHGVVVYSVGPDGKDDDGKFRPAPKGLTDPDCPDGFDIGLRLWDPEHRRQPPLPPVLPRGPKAKN
jgi:hypothetical protein